MKMVFVGGGNMATALIAGMREQGFAQAAIHVVEPNADQAALLVARYGVTTVPSVDASVQGADVLVLAVKPQQMEPVCHALRPWVGGALVVSIAAGIRIDALRRWLGNDAALVRVMPNTPAMVQAGVSGLYATEAVSAEQRTLADQLLGAVGRNIWLEQEAQLDAITAVSGSGPAYVFYFIEALQEAAQQAGFDAATAHDLALGTFAGAVKLASSSDEALATLRARVTSKGGTTERGVAALEAGLVKAVVARAVADAEARSRELGEQLG